MLKYSIYFLYLFSAISLFSSQDLISELKTESHNIHKAHPQAGLHASAAPNNSLLSENIVYVIYRIFDLFNKLFQNTDSDQE